MNVMIDLETLSTRPNAVVLSIGAVAFDKSGVKAGSEFYYELDIDQQTEKRRHISGETLSWWMTQSDGARDVFHHGGDVSDILSRFYMYLAEFDEPLVWSNGADFDLPILQGLAYDFGYSPPWAYRSQRCYRTLKNIVSPLCELPKNEEEHNALSDAKHQAECAVLMLHGTLRDDL